MSAYAIGQVKPLVPSLWVPTKFGIELERDGLERKTMRFVDRLFKTPFLDRIHLMSGSDGNWLSSQIQKAVDGGAAIGTPTTGQNWYIGLWTASIDDTMTGATASEAAYTSYARLALLNTTTIFANGTGTTTWSNSWPADAAKNFATSTGGTSTVTFMAKLNGNAGTSADKCGAWCSVTSVTINSGDTPQLAQNAVTQTRD